MDAKFKYYGIKKGRSFIMNENDKTILGNYLAKFEDGKEMQMTLSPRRKQRTSGQPGEETNFNGYLWGVIYKIIGDEIGEDDLDYIHYWMQIKTGNVKGMPDRSVVPAGTSEMNGGDFADYCSKVRRWAAAPGNICEHGLFIPEPHEDELGYGV